MDLAFELGDEQPGGERRVEGLARRGGVAGGEPGVAGLDPEVAAAAVLLELGVLGRGFEGGRGLRPFLLRRQGEAEALRGHDAAARAEPGLRLAGGARRRGSGEGEAGAVAVVGRVDGAGGLGGGGEQEGDHDAL